MRSNGKKIHRMNVTQTRRGKTYRRTIFSCLYQFSVTAGTVFHDSHLPSRTWFMVVAMLCEAKKGISANQVKRHFQINYRRVSLPMDQESDAGWKYLWQARLGRWDRGSR